jgi:hypothetical protein
MPVISRFLGIVIRMYFNDHAPPHFHAFYGDDEAVMRIDPVTVLAGELPPRALALVTKWATLHQDEIMENWRRVERDQAPQEIAGLE